MMGDAKPQVHVFKVKRRYLWSCDCGIAGEEDGTSGDSMVDYCEDSIISSLSG